MPRPAPTDVPSLLRALLDDDPGRPRLTWYGPGGERVELSAKVLDNWVAKSAGLLVEDLDAGPGTRVLLDLPVHWRSVVWALAAWSCGAHVVLPGAAATAGPDDVLLTADPGAAGASPAQLVAVALPALATSFGPDLPEGALDAAVEVRAHADVFVAPVRPAPADPALTGADGRVVPHGELLASSRAAAGPDWPAGVRLLTASADPLAGWLAPLAAGGSLVLVHDGGLVDPDGDAGRRLADQEGVTARR